MKDYITLGTAPLGEDTVQITDPDYITKVYEESRKYIGQLHRIFGELPEGNRFTLKSFSHDFGTYHEVVIWYDEDFPDSIDFAYRVENNLPEEWDEISKRSQVGGNL